MRAFLHAKLSFHLGPQTASRGAFPTRTNALGIHLRGSPPPHRVERRTAHLAPTAVRKPEAVRCPPGPRGEAGRFRPDDCGALPAALPHGLQGFCCPPFLCVMSFCL